MDGGHRLVEPVLGLDQLAAATAEGGEAAEEAGVHRLVDADGVDADAVKPRGERGDQAVLVADLAVGDEHQHAVALGVREQAGRFAQRLQHLGAAAGIEPGEMLDGAVAVAIARRDQPAR